MSGGGGRGVTSLPASSARGCGRSECHAGKLVLRRQAKSQVYQVRWLVWMDHIPIRALYHVPLPVLQAR